MNIKEWQDIIKNKRKNTNFNDYVRDIASWLPLVLHKNNGMVSKFPESDRVKGVIDFNKFDNDADSMTDYGRSYNFDQDFFHNFQSLLKSTELWNLTNFSNNENAGYADTVYTSKNVYLSNTVITGCEDILYSFSIKDHSREVLNSMMVFDGSEIIYKGRGVMKSFKIFYSNYIYNCNNIWFSSNLNGCNECIFCDGLDNKSYCINNIQYEKEDYKTQKYELLSQREKYLDYYSNVNQRGNDIGSNNTNGNFNLYGEDVNNGYYTYQVKEGSNLVLVGGDQGDENMYDCFTAGAGRSADFYGLMGAGIGADNLYCSCHINTSSNIYYCYRMDNCSYCLGCLGMKNKSYCILNKQYTKEERYELANKIFEQMNSDGILGEFWPGWMNPFYFNDTAASIIKDFDPTEIKDRGYLWRDGELKVDIPTGADVISISDLDSYQGFDSDGNWQIDTEIMNKVIYDDKGKYYRIVKMEYDFLVKYGLPLPRQHWFDRIKEHLQVK